MRPIRAVKLYWFDVYASMRPKKATCMLQSRLSGLSNPSTTQTDPLTEAEKMPYSTSWKAWYVWKKARPVKGKIPNLYRRDYHGNVSTNRHKENAVRWGGRLIISGRNPTVGPTGGETFKHFKLARIRGNRTRRLAGEVSGFASGH